MNQDTKSDSKNKDSHGSDVDGKKKIYPYHPDGFERKTEGFLGSLTDKQEEALEKMKEIVAKDDDIEIERWLCKPGESEEHFLLRFLRARKFDIEKTLKMLKADIEWRIAEGIEGLVDEDPSDFMDCDMKLVKHTLYGVERGADKFGRPVTYKKYGDNCVIHDLKKHTSIENMIKYHVWQTEQKCSRRLGEQSEKTGYSIEQFTVIVDAAGWYLSLASRDAYKFLKGIADIDSAHYPERLGSIVVLNAPWALSIAWRIVRTWLDDRTKEKVHIIRGPSEYEPILFDLIDKDQIPSDYGGSGDPLPTFEQITGDEK